MGADDAVMKQLVQIWASEVIVNPTLIWYLEIYFFSGRDSRVEDVKNVPSAEAALGVADCTSKL